MANWSDIRKRHIHAMVTTAETLGNILRNTTQEQAETLRDGPEGWTILEILCHLRDFDAIFRNRAQMMLDNDNPDLPAYDHEAMVIEKNYAEEDLAYAYDEYRLSRKHTREFFKSLSDVQWERTGVHPERSDFSMTDAVIQVVHHDIDHTEQITRLLEQEVPGSGSLPSESFEDDDNG
ncbi:MAG: DinB family protein [Anaerolineae bacterium]|nr:DinB family protein [Anaerolineae bacterium]MDQ7034011.1 DinB family protein [Anaerolineae bacterium]